MINPRGAEAFVIVADNPHKVNLYPSARGYSEERRQLVIKDLEKAKKALERDNKPGDLFASKMVIYIELRNGSFALLRYYMSGNKLCLVFEPSDTRIKSLAHLIVGRDDTLPSVIPVIEGAGRPRKSIYPSTPPNQELKCIT